MLPMAVTSPQKIANKKEKGKVNMAQDLRTNERTKFPYKAHLLFEQSGTFKKAFIKYGIPAEDYDILNDFGETDHQIDLFQGIRNAYHEKPSIFDGFGKEDIVMAFFPCVRFEAQITLAMRGEANQMQGWSLNQKLEYAMKLNNELNELYQLVSMLVIIALRKKFKLIIENPYSEQHYLKRYWCVKPKLIDNDRTIRGDYYKKPTQYWFINFDPHHNFEWFEQTDRETYNIENAHTFASKLGKSRTVVRSMIAPDYAERFIREFIL